MMQTAGYEILNRAGQTVAVVLPDRARATAVAAGYEGNFLDLVRRRDALAELEAERTRMQGYIATLHEGMAMLTERLKLLPDQGGAG